MKIRSIFLAAQYSFASKCLPWRLLWFSKPLPKADQFRKKFRIAFYLTIFFLGWFILFLSLYDLLSRKNSLTFHINLFFRRNQIIRQKKTKQKIAEMCTMHMVKWTISHLRNTHSKNLLAQKPVFASFYPVVNRFKHNIYRNDIDYL